MSMRYYPAFLNIEHRSCLVVGGGGVGTRKVDSLLRCGAEVTVVSPEVSERLSKLSEEGKIILKRRAFRDADLDGMFLVFGATDNSALNRRIQQNMERRRGLCNIADQPKLGNFMVPSVIRRGGLTIAISTSGKSPAMARQLRQQLEAMFGSEYGLLLDLMGAIRAKLLEGEHAPERHKALFEQLIQSDLLEMIQLDDRQGINTLLNQVLGPGYRFEDLMGPT